MKSDEHKQDLNSRITELQAADYSVIPIFSLIKEPVLMTRKGLTGRDLAEIRKRLGLDLLDLAKITQVTTRTLQNKKNDDPLGITVSEKLISLLRLFDHGIRVFQSVSRFKKWLKSPLPILLDETPLEQLDTVFGFELVQELLYKIEHGVTA